MTDKLSCKDNVSLIKLIKPKSIAVVGCTDRLGSFGYHTANNCLLNKSIIDHIYYVNPKKEELFGKKVYSSISALPEVVDCVMICTPKKTTIPLIEEAARLGTKAAVVFASGFSEEGSQEGTELEKQLFDIAKANGIAILGPNCAGMVNNVDKINLWGMQNQFDMETRHTGIGIISQSGFVVSNIVRQPGCNISYAISTGNGNITELEDFFEFLVDDDQVKVVSIYLEGVKNPHKFVECLKKAALKRKPVIVLKSGKSKIGSAATVSHTGNLAGNAQVYSAIFKKYGVIEVECLEELLCASQMFSVLGDNVPSVRGIAGINLSGGENTICADLCEKYGVTLPSLSQQDKEEMRKYIPTFATPNNPLDPTTVLFGDKEKLIGLLNVLDKVPAIGGIAVGGSVETVINSISEKTCLALIEARKNGLKKPMYVVPSFEATRNQKYRTLLEENGIVLMSSAKTAYRCLSLLSQFIDYDVNKKDMQNGTPLQKRVINNAVALTEYESKMELKAFGLDVAHEVLARNHDEVLEACDKLKFPIVEKVSSKDISHKTDAGGVKLNIFNKKEAIQAFDEIMANVKQYKPDANIEGVIMGDMAEKGVEIIAGISNDPQFGPMLLIGLGGIFVEMFKDVALAPCPVSKQEALEMLQSLKSYKLLEGYRGSKRCDIECLTDLMTKVSQYAYKNAETVKELDLNPVFVYEQCKGVRIIDAVLVKSK